MFLGPAILKLTHSLDSANQQDGNDISSHSLFKERTITCLLNLIKNAPESEFKTLFKMNDIEVFLSYLMSVLCGIIISDKSNSNKKLALETLEALIEQLQLMHALQTPDETCSTLPILQGLPGISSNLFKFIMKDTKLPKSLIAKAVETLWKLITVSFEHCDRHRHQKKAEPGNSFAPQLQGKNLIDTCNNLSARIHLMLNYIMTHSDELHVDIKHEALNFCHQILRKTHLELITQTLKMIVRYTAFISLNLDDSCDRSSAGVQLKLMLITDEIKFAMTNCDNNEHDQLDSVILSCLFKVLDNLEENALTMLVSERQSELAVLCGLVKLLSPQVITTFMEVLSRKKQLLSILVTLTEFSVRQPFLFLTESSVESAQAVELNDGRIYTIEKRFAHLNEKEVHLVNTCCNLLGHTTDWPLLIDIFTNDLAQFSSPNNMYVSHHVIKGCLDRPQSTSYKSLSRFTSQMLQKYTEEVCVRLASSVHKHGDQKFSSDILMIVIAIETMVTFVELHLKSSGSPSQKIIILKDLLCPLLSWCSSSSRAISEASLTSLTQISQLYKHKSTKDLIENNIDYIIDGVSKMLDNFVCNPEVTNVIAITFKLSSIETFYYFKDIYNRVFKTLARYHYTDKSKTLALLLFRTVAILNDWKFSAESDAANHKALLAMDSEIRDATISGLDIDRLIQILKQRTKENESINERMNQMEVRDEDQKELARKIQHGEDIDEMNEDNNDEPAPSDEKKNRSEEVILVERIMKHCIGLMSSSRHETRILAIKTAGRGFRLLREDENTLLPLIHQAWAPLMSRLTQDYMKNLEENLSAFECLVSMASSSKDFIKRRTLDSILPRLCLFLESQANASCFKKEYMPYCMTMGYKCQLRILSDLGRLVYHTQIAYRNLWHIIRVTLSYLNPSQVPSLREAARASLHYLMALDADCVWFFAKRSGQLAELPFELIFEAF